MKTISRTTVLLNAYSANDLIVANGRLAIANTPVSLLWKKLFGYKAETYSAGAYSEVEFDFSAITPVSDGPHRLKLKNGNTSAIQTHRELVVYGDNTATPAEIATLFAQQVETQSGPQSVFEFVSFAANVLTVRLLDPTYAIIGYESDVVGLAVTVTPATLPIGDVDAEGVSGYVATSEYDKYTFLEEGTINEYGKDINVHFEDVVYVDNTIGQFGTDHASAVSGLTAISAATTRPYLAADQL